jgi:hypothetical protein
MLGVQLRYAAASAKAWLPFTASAIPRRARIRDRKCPNAPASVDVARGACDERVDKCGVVRGANGERPTRPIPFTLVRGRRRRLLPSLPRCLARAARVVAVVPTRSAACAAGLNAATPSRTRADKVVTSRRCMVGGTCRGAARADYSGSCARAALRARASPSAHQVGRDALERVGAGSAWARNGPRAPGGASARGRRVSVDVTGRSSLCVGGPASLLREVR